MHFIDKIFFLFKIKFYFRIVIKKDLTIKNRKTTINEVFHRKKGLRKTHAVLFIDFFG